MSPEEYIEVCKTFEKALEERCKEEGIALRKIHHAQTPNGVMMQFALNNEVYTLIHDGQQPRWEFSGHLRN